MEAALALLADRGTSNAVRKLAWRVHVRYATGLKARRLEPHVSLKQPFPIADLDALSDYAQELAGHLRPIDVTLARLCAVAAAVTDPGSGVLWFDVEDEGELARLRQRVQGDLERRFGSVEAPFDGASYRFHMTVAIGGPSLSTYRRIVEDLGGEVPPLRCQLDRLAIFAYDRLLAAAENFLTYRVLELGA